MAPIKIKRKARGGVPAALDLLYEEGFFSTQKDIADISNKLATHGIRVPASSLATTLMRSVKPGGKLARDKEGDKWKYKEARPVSAKNNASIEGVFPEYVLHTKVINVSWQQFKNGHYKEAVQNALVEVIDQVKIKTNHPKDDKGRDLDGDNLMNQIFAVDGNRTPIIKFNDLKTSLDVAEQRGLYLIYKGIVGIRDKKAHLNFIQNDSVKAFEYLALASLLIRLLEEN